MDQVGVSTARPTGKELLLSLILARTAHNASGRGSDVNDSDIDAVQTGETVFFSASQPLSRRSRFPLHQLIFSFPHRALAEFLQESERFGADLSLPIGESIDDATIRYFGGTILPYVRGTYFSQAVVDHLLCALCGYVAERYTSRKLAPVVRPSGGLASWQQRRACDLMCNSLVEGVSLQKVADVCGLSQSAFVKGFRKSLGVPPHQWLLLKRVERAAELMSGSNMSLVDVALSCGFADQSHFTRIFTQKMGVSPGAYRREVKSCAA